MGILCNQEEKHRTKPEFHCRFNKFSILEENKKNFHEDSYIKGYSLNKSETENNYKNQQNSIQNENNTFNNMKESNNTKLQNTIQNENQIFNNMNESNNTKLQNPIQNENQIFNNMKESNITEIQNPIFQHKNEDQIPNNELTCNFINQNNLIQNQTQLSNNSNETHYFNPINRIKNENKLSNIELTHNINDQKTSFQLKQNFENKFITNPDKILLQEDNKNNINNNNIKGNIAGYNTIIKNLPEVKEKDIIFTTFQKYKEINVLGSEIKLELKVPGVNVPNNVRPINGNLTLNVVEKQIKTGDYIFDRGMSIRNLNKTLFQLQSEQNSILSFNLLKKEEKLIKDLEECEINFINIDGRSCYQSATMQGFIHILFPMAIKYVNQKRQLKGYEKVKSLDELKNNSIFNNTVIDTIKSILNIQQSGSGGVDKNGLKRFSANKLFEIAPPILLGGPQDINNTVDVANLNDKISDESKKAEDAINKAFISLNQIRGNPPKKSLLYNIFTGIDLVKVFEINKSTIISEIIKFKIEGSNKYYGNIVLKFSEDDLKDENLDICKLIHKCPQLINKTIIETSEILFIIVDRILPNDTIKKKFIVYEKLYLENLKEWFELKFVIFHQFFSQFSGHYRAYSKFRGEWYEFDDCVDDYSEKKAPPLNESSCPNYYPISFYYVKINKTK